MNPATYQYQSDFARKYIALGRAGGKLEDIGEGEPPTLLTEFARKYIALGRAQVEAEAQTRAFARGHTAMLLKLLRFKGFTAAPELVARVEACEDIAQLDAWAERVLTATTLDDIFPAAP